MAGFLDMVDDTLGLLERFSGTAAGSSRRPAATSGADVRASAASPASGDPRIRRTRRTEFSVDEAIDAETGRPAFVVRNARGDRATCSSREFAERVRQALG